MRGGLAPYPRAARALLLGTVDDAIDHIENAEFRWGPAWMARGACVGADDPDVFFPERGVSAAPAKAICGRCSVRRACLAWALENEDYGVWGGLSAGERKRFKKGAA